MKTLILIPAYGRSYDTVKQDWQDGLDFKILGGPYCSIRDAADLIWKGMILKLSLGKGLYETV